MRGKNKSNRVHINEGGNLTFVIEPLLPLGKENAISTKALMQALQCSERELRAIVSRERQNGAIICSAATGGYFKPSTRKELKDFCENLESQAITILRTLRSARKILKETEGQLSISRESGINGE
ncbi:hypothetical protein [Ohessyouella blattaphilus]|uniref:Uncharacterized protein n=1 Tax=Ohessyouella blattaphilus TaxID=2949333 RepID=A0ABT1EHZ7_9FIRM|nr:hypothetical protein [Ohessyouella blattaphilus]MCP1110330.1 hypothetical protein [Ohessyouella blattaphilus]MCR8563724.1 hypothetical protein [Ohessyouella blattaphilus]